MISSAFLKKNPQRPIYKFLSLRYEITQKNIRTEQSLSGCPHEYAIKHTKPLGLTPAYYYPEPKSQKINIYGPTLIEKIAESSRI